MKFFRQLIVTVALAMCGVAAHADIYVPKDPGAPGVFSNTWTFDDSSTGTHAAGAEFKDVFYFNVPDAQNISVSLTDLFKTSSSDVSFLGGALILFSYSDFTELQNVDGTQKSTLSGGAWLLDSGTYGLYVVGTYLVDGASYGGQVLGTPVVAVPEPATVLLLLAGLALVAVVAQRRRA
ncbi:PEP-CTERM sorting domain-containing protein [Duganella sp. FT135W]|uniref:PEP-CTERM sorting domain-containing protein n=1 Tax=Duganella flavida TaxID=2692175 RepID=A0A6L8K0Q2_9BURK|nr:FxDxF family PEP-CTERM protein [Duganella flavida]MYM21053.1 PEP-CTERM sorting domain-containing protein [Duganella flavida]